MKIGAIILLNWIVNGLGGFYIFARSFNDKNFGYSNIVTVVFFVSIFLGIISGLALKGESLKIIRKVVISAVPLLAFLGLMVLGSIEKGNAKQIIIAIFIFIMPVILQAIAWFFSAAIMKRF